MNAWGCSPTDDSESEGQLAAGCRRRETTHVGPRHLVDVEELVVTPRDDPVLLLALVTPYALGEEPSSSRRKGTRLALVGIIGHLPRRQDPRCGLSIAIWQLDLMLGRPDEVAKRPGRLLLLLLCGFRGRFEGEMCEACGGRGVGAFRSIIMLLLLLPFALYARLSPPVSHRDLLLFVVEVAVVLCLVRRRSSSKVDERFDEFGRLCILARPRSRREHRGRKV